MLLCAAGLPAHSISSAPEPPAFALGYHIRVTAATLPNLPSILSAALHPSNHYVVSFENCSPPPSLAATLALPNVQTYTANSPTPHGVSEALADIDAAARLTSLAPPPAFVLLLPPGAAPALSAAATRRVLLLASSVARAPLFMRDTPPATLRRLSGDEDLLWYDPALVFTQNSSAAARALVTGYAEAPQTRLQHPDRRRRAPPLLPRGDAAPAVLPAALADAAVSSLAAKRLLLRLAETRDSRLRFWPALAAATRATLHVKSAALVCGGDANAAAAGDAAAHAADAACLFWVPDAADRAPLDEVGVSRAVLAEVSAAAAGATAAEWDAAAPPPL